MRAFIRKRAAVFALAAGIGLLGPGLGVARSDVLHLTPEQGLEIARAAYLAGQAEIAGQIARGLAKADPENPLVHLLLSATEVQLGRPEAGLAAGKRAWRLAGPGAETRPLRYEIARNTAKAALEAGRPMIAQYWLRRSLDVAPDAQARAASGRDIGLVRDRSPLRFSFEVQAGPSDNLNGGAESGIFRVGDLVIGDLANGAEALSGTRASFRLQADYALPERGAASQTVLSLSAEALRNRIDASARAKAGSLTSRDLDASRLGFGLRRDMRIGPDGRPLSLSVELAQTWAGGAVAGPTLGFGAQAGLWQGTQGTFWLRGQVERTWDGARAQGRDLYGLSLIGQSAFGTTRATAALSLQAARSGFENSTYDAANLSLQVAPAWRIAGASVEFGANLGMRDYESFSLIGGAVAVTGGRQDRSVGVSMDLAFDNLGVMGFAPVLSLRHGKTRSNVSRYETATTGISLGLSSSF